MIDETDPAPFSRSFITLLMRRSHFYSRFHSLLAFSPFRILVSFALLPSSRCMNRVSLVHLT